MNENKVESLSDSDSKAGRERSTIGFPYYSLNDAETMANAIFANVGTGTCTVEQLAAWCGMSPKSSGFRTQIAATRLFGLLDNEGDDYSLTSLGQHAIDPKTQRAARVEAFLNVPLFKAVFDKYNGHTLPPPAALEREINLLGVSEKQKKKARQVFDKSAELAAFFEHGKGRLVQPGVKSGEEPPPPPPLPPPGGGSGDGGGSGIELDLDPLLLALLQKIPTKGDGWPRDKRLRWFKTFAMNVSQVYDDEDGNPVEFDIKLFRDPTAYNKDPN